MKTTLKDIADATGFSVNTVSHALRNMPDISDGAKEKIREAARRLDYIPNLRAGGFKSGKSGTIAVILPDIVNPHFTLLFHEIELFFQERGITSLFMNSAENAAEEERLIRVAIGQNADGIILCPTENGAAGAHLLQRAKIPYTLVGRTSDALPGADRVLCDDEAGGFLATEHLLSLGHRRIGCVRVGGISSDAERYRGYLRAHRVAGIFADEALLLPLSLRDGKNPERIRAFLTAHPDCTAIFAFSDILAMQILAAARSAGRRVPETLSVIGFDRIGASYPLPLSLATVGTAGATLGKTTAAHLFRRMTEPDAPPNVTVLPLSLFPGESVKEPDIGR